MLSFDIITWPLKWNVQKKSCLESYLSYSFLNVSWNVINVIFQVAIACMGAACLNLDVQMQLIKRVIWESNYQIILCLINHTYLCKQTHSMLILKQTFMTSFFDCC